VNKKGLIVAAFFGTIMLTSLAAGVLLNNTPIPSENVDLTSAENRTRTITGTPADNFYDDERAKFCGSGIAKSTEYVKEYSIPTACTNPLAVVNDFDGNVWFAQTNTGNLAKFDPITETFTEFENPYWPKNGRSMMWGIDYSPDGALWFTDESYDSIWRFSISDEKYQRLDYPSESNSLPQKLEVKGSQIIINDFTGNKITFLDPSQSENDLKYLSLPSPINGTLTGDFAMDENNNTWYTNWFPQQGGVLVKFDQEKYRNSLGTLDNNSLLDYVEIFQLSSDINTPNGIASDGDKIWIADTTNSAIFSFDPLTKQFTQFATPDPRLSTYGNSTGVIKSPLSRPYWIESDSNGRIIFNEHAANSIAIMDPKTESLVEYLIPSKNPNWADCINIDDCGIAQIFDFSIYEDKIWFTEWVENNLGVIDTSIPLPFDIVLNSTQVSLKAGESRDVSFSISPKSPSASSEVNLILADRYNFLNATSNVAHLPLSETQNVDVVISSSIDSPPGTYKLLLGSQNEDISIGKFITVTIEP
jgi:virginiamycin B lyase